MINVIMLNLIKLLIFPITLASDLIVFPFITFFQNANVNFTDYIEEFDLFFHSVLLNGVTFARDVFLHVSHLPVPLYNFFIYFFAFRFAFHAFILFVKWLINIYYLIRGVHAKSSSKSS